MHCSDTALCILSPCFIFFIVSHLISASHWQSLHCREKKHWPWELSSFCMGSTVSLALKMLTQLTAQKRSKPRKALQHLCVRTSARLIEISLHCIYLFTCQYCTAFFILFYRARCAQLFYRMELTAFPSWKSARCAQFQKCMVGNSGAA